MSDPLTVSHQNLNWSRFWLFSKLLLVILAVATVFSAMDYVPSIFLIVNILSAVLLVGTLIFLTINKAQTLIIKIEANQLCYFCAVKKELITIPIDEITNVRTHFCELEIHTINRTHCLNLNHIKQEKQRWEIKEMVRNLISENGKRAVNF